MNIQILWYPEGHTQGITERKYKETHLLFYICHLITLIQLVFYMGKWFRRLRRGTDKTAATLSCDHHVRELRFICQQNRDLWATENLLATGHTK